MFSKKGKNLPLVIALFLIAFGFLARFLPHPPNFAPIAALALFASFYLPRKWALIVPLAAMFISDIFIGFYQLSVMAAVYFSFLLVALLGSCLKKHKKWYVIGGAAFLGAFIFFLITNFAVWLFTPLYVKTFSGLLQCYTMALPFFRNTLLGDFFYTACFFGLYELSFLFLKQKFALCRLPASKKYL